MIHHSATPTNCATCPISGGCYWACLRGDDLAEIAELRTSLQIILKAVSELEEGFKRRAKETGMGFVIPFPEAIKLLETADLIQQSTRDGSGST